MVLKLCDWGQGADGLERESQEWAPLSAWRGFPAWETPPSLARVRTRWRDTADLYWWSFHPVWLGIEPPNRVPHASGFASVISMH